MIRPRGILAVLRFQGKRSLTASRVVWWGLLALFAPAIVALIRWTTSGTSLQQEGWPVILYSLIPCVTCMLGVFLWATPVLQAELESQSWVYVAVRPGGVTSLLIGNYVLAVLWTASAALVSLTLSTWFTREDVGGKWWLLFARMIPFSVTAYAGLYLLIGVLFVKRAMLVAVTYTLLVEIVLSFLPAVVNRLTVQYRLRGLWIHWMGWRNGPPGYDGPPEIFGVEPVWQQVATLLGIAVVSLFLSLWIVRGKELSLGSEPEL